MTPDRDEPGRRCQKCGHKGEGARRDPVYKLYLCDACWALLRPCPGGLSPQQIRERYPATAQRLGL